MEHLIICTLQEQIWKLACLANITQSSKSDVDITQQEVHSNEMNKYAKSNTENKCNI